MRGPGLRPLASIPRSRSTVLGIWVVALVALASCGTQRPSLGADESPKEAVTPTSSTTDPTSTTVPSTTVSTPVDLAVVATATVPEIEVFVLPDALSSWWRFTNPVAAGGPLVFLVLDQSVEGWLEVLLPVRPNGTTGWVRTSDVSLAAHQYRLEVHLQEFRLDLFDAGEVVFSAEVGVARDNAPTPGGLYYITELLRPPETDSPYGSFAYGLSGFSDVFETFAGGPGQLGIHGTNDPASIGTQVSSGCVRLRNEDIERLVELLPLGTPVTIIP